MPSPNILRNRFGKVNSSKKASPNTDVPKIEKKRISRIRPRILDNKVAPLTRDTLPRIFTSNSFRLQARKHSYLTWVGLPTVVLPLPLGHHDSASDQAQSLDSDTSWSARNYLSRGKPCQDTVQPASSLPFWQYIPQKAQSLHQNDFLQKGPEPGCT